MADKKKDANKYLTRRGYIIKKKNLTPRKESFIRKELTAKPFELAQQKFTQVQKTFPVFLENHSKYYLPRFWGIQNFGKPDFEDFEGDSIDIDFKGKLRPHQETILNTFIPKLVNDGGGIVHVGCASGKCLSKNTKILCFNGDIILAQDVKVGTHLIGDDSQPREVISICSGTERMYTVSQKYAPSYEVNESHILSLFDSHKNEYVDMNLLDYLSLPSPTNLYGYRRIIEYKQKILSNMFDPYFYGANMQTLEKDYYINSSAFRQELLAGILDFKSISHEYHVDVFCPSYLYAENLKQLSWSLGFQAIRRINNTIQIFGNFSYIPLRILKMPKFKNTLYYKIKVEYKKVDNYYGFELKGNNRRFLLHDCTVTHNTVMALNIIAKMKYKTLVVVHKSFLLDQWQERINQFLPDAKVGIIRGPKIQIENCDIVLSMLQSLSMKTYETNTFSSFGLTIVDECHHVAAEVFSRCFTNISSKYVMGLSATLDRKDGLRKIFEWHLGEPVICDGPAIPVGTVHVKVIQSFEEHTIEKNIRDCINLPAMIQKLVDSKERNTIIINQIIETYEDERNILVLSERRNHLLTIFDKLKELNIESGLYIGGMKPEQLKESEGKRILLGTFNMIAEGFDLSTLDTLILATPKSDVVQACGRILRKLPEKRDKIPLIIDIHDTCVPFGRKIYERKKYYKKNKFTILENSKTDDDYST